MWQTDAARFKITAFKFFDCHSVNTGFVFHKNTFFFVILVSGWSQVIFAKIALLSLYGVENHTSNHKNHKDNSNNANRFFAFLNSNANFDTIKFPILQRIYANDDQTLSRFTDKRKLDPEQDIDF